MLKIMKTIVFKNDDDFELTTHINSENSAIICIECDDKFLIYQFDDEMEILELIEQLQIVRTELINIKNG